MKATGRHLLVEYQECSIDVLNDRDRIEGLMQQAAVASETTIVSSVFHPFFPQGISGVVVIEESHLSIHTWPEYGYAAVDFFTCGKGIPEKAHEVLKAGLQSKKCELMFVERGEISEKTTMAVRSHITETDSGQATHLSNLREAEILEDTSTLKVADASK